MRAGRRCPPLAPAGHEGLVDQRGKLSGDVGTVRQLVDHEHDDEVLDRIDGVPAAVRPTPAERSHRRHAVGTVALGRLEPKSKAACTGRIERSEEHTSELQSRGHLVCRLLLEKKKSYSSY